MLSTSTEPNSLASRYARLPSGDTINCLAVKLPCPKPTEEVTLFEMVTKPRGSGHPGQPRTGLPETVAVTMSALGGARTSISLPLGGGVVEFNAFGNGRIIVAPLTATVPPSVAEPASQVGLKPTPFESTTYPANPLARNATSVARNATSVAGAASETERRGSRAE